VDDLEYITVPANGLHFHVATAGAGPRLALCLHGFPESSFSWRYQLSLLAGLGYRVWAPDLRGYGGTTRPANVAAYALEHLLADVDALIEAAESKEVLLIGHDWGALIAWYYAMFGRHTIAKLVIMNVPHPALAQRGLYTLRQLKKSWYIFFFQLPWLPEYLLSRNDYASIAEAFRGMAVDKSRFPQEVLEVYQQGAAQPGALTAMVNYYRALLRGLRRIRARGMPRIRVPVLMLWGEADAALGKELTYGTERYVEDLVLRYLPRVSHWVQQEAPETVNALMAAWLRGEVVPYAPGATPA
jgi:pimeloyl-ACP methyl ester carboxylesterase